MKTNERTTGFPLPPFEFVDLVDELEENAGDREQVLRIARYLDELLLTPLARTWIQWLKSLRVRMVELIDRKGVEGALRDGDIAPEDLRRLLLDPQTLEQLGQLSASKRIEPRVTLPFRAGRRLAVVNRAAAIVGYLAAATLVVSTVVYAAVILPQLRDFEDFWSPFAPREVDVSREASKPITIVVGDAPVLLPDGTEAHGFVGNQDAKAVGMLCGILAERGADPAAIEVATSGEILSGEARSQGPICIIGGPGTSRFALETLAQLRGVSDPDDPDALRRGFRFVVLPAGRANAFSRPAKPSQLDEEPQLGIEDVETGELCPIDLSTYPPDPDAAVVVRGNLPNGRPVLIIAGFETRGTLGALKALSEPSDIASEFNKAYRTNGYAEMVIQMERETGRPIVYKFKNVENPRGK